ncbi:hypothetical protein [Microvirga sesbaniae]|uniref:hypothetical protein n=1 Tax=Microvirga sesbaniae TaxID=681392 RepID=UPI0021C8ED2D|nr:hypothetical protein [Microvirga sp. HBU67692]
MLIWSVLATAVLTGVTLGLFTTGAPEWATQAAELITAVAVFVLVCLVESGEARSSKPSS